MADGYVIIDTAINVAGAQKGLAQLQREITRTTTDIDKQRAKLKPYFDELDRIHEATDKMLELADTTEQVNNLLEMEQGEVDKLNVQYAEQLDTLTRLEETLSGQTTELEDQVAAQEEAARAAEEHADSAEEIEDAYDGTSENIDEIKGSLDGMNVSIKDALKNIIKYSVGVGSVLALFNKVRSAAKEGLSIIAESDENARAAVEGMEQSFNQIKAALGYAILPLVQALIPILNEFVPLIQTLSPLIQALVPIMQALVPLVQTLAQLIEALMPLLELLTPILELIAGILNLIVGAIRLIFGLSASDRSYKGIQNLEAHYAGVESAAVGASSAIKDMKQNLSGLDEINTFERMNAAMGGGGGGVPSIKAPDVTVEAETVTFEDEYEKDGIHGFRHSYDLQTHTNNPVGAMAQAWRTGPDAELYTDTGMLVGWQTANGLLVSPMTLEEKEQGYHLSSRGAKFFGDGGKFSLIGDNLNKEIYKYERDPLTGATTDVRKAWATITSGDLESSLERSLSGGKNQHGAYRPNGRYRPFDVLANKKTTNQFTKVTIPRAYSAITSAIKKAGGTLDTYYNKRKDSYLDLAEETGSELQTYYNLKKGEYLDLMEETTTDVITGGRELGAGTVQAVKEGWATGKIAEYFGKVRENVDGKFESEPETMETTFQGAAASVKKGWASGTVASYFNDVNGNIQGQFTGQKAPSRYMGAAFDEAWDATKEAFPQTGSNSVGNWFAGHVGDPMEKAMLKAINKIIDIINQPLEEINDQGNKLGSAFSGSRVQTISKVEGPRLASGAVIPPNAPFAAILGDQRHGNNFEAPEDLLRQIVREEAGNAGTYQFTATINRKTLFDEIVDEAKIRTRTTGKNPLTAF